VISVLVVSGVRLYRDGIGRILEQSPDIRVAGMAETCEQATRHRDGDTPDVVLLDAPIGDATTALRLLGGSAAKVVVLGVVEREADVIAWAEAGAAGYVSREGSGEDLTAMIRAVANGETLCSPRMVAALLRQLAVRARSSAQTAPAIADRLTPREREVADLLGEGLSNKQIAGRLCIEVPTVKNHVHNILRKFEVERRGQAAAYLRMRPSSLRVVSPSAIHDHSAA